MTVQDKLDTVLSEPMSTEGEGLSPAWRRALVWLGLAVVALLTIYANTAIATVAVWYNSVTFQHAFLIIPICGYLVLLRRERLARMTPVPSIWGVVALIPVVFLWLLGDIAGVHVAQQLALVMMMQALTLAILGPRVCRVLIFPLAYLLFAVPIGDQLVPSLQEFTAMFTVKALRLAGVPVFSDGFYITIPNGNFLVAEACSGVRYLIASLALGTLFANLTYVSWPRRLVFVGLSIIVPIIANGVRAFGIVYLAHVSDNTIAVGFDHIIYGWIFFAFVIFILFAIGSLFRDADVDARMSKSREEDLTGATLARHASLAITLAALVVIAAGPALASYIDARPGAAVNAIAAPDIVAPWSMSGDEAPWRPDFKGADFIVSQVYEKSAERAELYIAYYARQDQNAEVVNGLNAFAGGEDWVNGGVFRQRTVVDGNGMDVISTRYSGLGQRRRVWSWYWVDGVFTANPYYAKLLQLRAKLLGGTQAAAVIGVATNEGEGKETEAVLASLLASIQPLAPVLERIAGLER